jgi:tetratricopeptide (TPR) repeat protein
MWKSDLKIKPMDLDGKTDNVEIGKQTDDVVEQGWALLSKELKWEGNIPNKWTIEYLKYLEDLYNKQEHESKQNTIKVMRFLIEAAKVLALFQPDSHPQVIKFYEKLILCFPTTNTYYDANTYYEFAFYLQQINDIDKAIANYNKALEIYQTLTKKEPEEYLPYVNAISEKISNLRQSLK